MEGARIWTVGSTLVDLREARSGFGMFGNSGLALLLCCMYCLPEQIAHNKQRCCTTFISTTGKATACTTGSGADRWIRCLMMPTRNEDLCKDTCMWIIVFNRFTIGTVFDRRFGMLFSLKEVVARLSPTGSDNLHVMKTNNFVMHHYQSLTGFVFLINTKSDVPGTIEMI